MRAFMAAIVVIAAISLGAWYVLGNLDRSARTVYSTASVRF